MDKDVNFFYIVMTSSIEYQAFTALYDTLQTGIQSGIDDVIAKTYSKGLIAPCVKNNRRSAQLLLDAIQQRIHNVSNTYEQFACVLDEIPAFQYLAVEMRKKKIETLQRQVS